MVAYTFNALFAPRGTSDSVVEPDYQTLLKIMDDTGFKKELESCGP